MENLQLTVETVIARHDRLKIEHADRDKAARAAAKQIMLIAIQFAKGESEMTEEQLASIIDYEFRGFRR